MQEAAIRKFDVVLVWKLDRFGRSLIDCLSAIRELTTARVRFIAITQGIDTGDENPAARFQLQIMAAFAEYEREIIRERAMAGALRYRQDFAAGRIGRERSSRSGKNCALGRPRRIFDREQVSRLRSEGLSLRQIASRLGVGLGTITRVLKCVPKSDSTNLEKAP
jgi:DNA invertase Pin-like site-specific DNA recombinase